MRITKLRGQECITLKKYFKKLGYTIQLRKSGTNKMRWVHIPDHAERLLFTLTYGDNINGILQEFRYDTGVCVTSLCGYGQNNN